MWLWGEMVFLDSALYLYGAVLCFGEWHPNWFFRISKFTLPLLHGPYVPPSYDLFTIPYGPLDALRSKGCGGSILGGRKPKRDIA